MDHICKANKLNGLQCTKRKVNVHFCKIHTTNEICGTCGSDEISSNDTTLKNCGRSLCNTCKKVECDEILARAHETLIEVQKKAEIQRIEYEEIMRKFEIQTKLFDEQSQIRNARFMEMMNSLSI